MAKSCILLLPFPSSQAEKSWCTWCALMQKLFCSPFPVPFAVSLTPFLRCENQSCVCCPSDTCIVDLYGGNMVWFGAEGWWTLWHSSSTLQDTDTSSAQKCRVDLCLDLNLVSSLSEIWVKIQPGSCLAVEKVWVSQLVLHIEPRSWLGSVGLQQTGLRHRILQACEKGSGGVFVWWIFFPPDSGKAGLGGQISLLHNLTQYSARETLAWVPAGRRVGQ